MVILAPFLFAVTAAPAWTVQEMGQGGETFVSTDGKGAVYISSHLPTQLIVSRDWGKTFAKPTVFEDSLGDMVNLALPEGRVLVTYMDRSIKGLIARTSSDFGVIFEKGAAPFDRPLDREWPAYDAKRNQIAMIYSDGYIGGPKSKGAYVSLSPDYGKTWTETARADNEPEGHYAVDPHIVTSKDGKLYAFWNTSSDYDKVDNFRVSRSLDGGKTFVDHQSMQAIEPASGDTQERWMLGGLAAFGKDTVSSFYVRYQPVTVDGVTTNSMQVMVRTSFDGGKTYGPATPAVNPGEFIAATRQYRKMSDAKGPNNYPIQMEVWGAYDQKGMLHLVYFDNRNGHATVEGTLVPAWQLRHVEFNPKTGQSLPSDPVSDTFAAARPAMDFICCTTDSKYIYATWTENRNSKGGWDFTGKFMFARRALK